jgi:phosphatidylserine decarboxylase
MVLTLVGATIVGSMATVWHGVVNRSRQNTVREWHYADTAPPVTLKKGDEMGRFLLGSTVVLLFPAGPLQFNPDWQAGGPVQLGQAMASEQVHT